MKNKLIGTVIIATTLCLEVKAANISETWTGGSSGNLIWEDSVNWNPAGIPSNDGTNNYYAIIGDATSNRNITTSGALTVSGLSITQTSAAGVNALTLGGDLTVLSVPSFSNNSGFTNSTGDASRLVIDLNGHTLSFGALTTAQTNLGTASNYTLSSSSGAGTFVMPTIGSASTNVLVGNNVTVNVNSVNALNVSGWTWATGSTLQASGTNASAVNLQAGTLGSLVIGSTSNTAATKLIMRNPTTRVTGNVNILAYTGVSGGDASSFTFYNASTSLYVGGNFTDVGTNAFNYGSGTIFFNGGSTTARQVSIQRSTLTTNFQVGESTSITGNIALEHSLTTSGTFRVLANSEVDVDANTLTAGTITLDSGATIALKLGETSGLITSTGNLTLSGFNLEIAVGSGWIDGDDLILFTYTGTLTGTPTLLSVVGPSGLTYGSLVHDAATKSIYLSDVTAVPEPTTMALAACGVLLFGGCLIRRKALRQG